MILVKVAVCANHATMLQPFLAEWHGSPSSIQPVLLQLSTDLNVCEHLYVPL